MVGPTKALGNLVTLKMLLDGAQTTLSSVMLERTSFMLKYVNYSYLTGCILAGSVF